MTLQRLYKTAKSGATQIIDMEINGAVYTRHWGQLDGKMQSKATTATAKNVGRINETTPEEQAIIEAKAVWVKKQKVNYSTSIEAPVTKELPMKVNEYKKHLKKIKPQVFTSPKLNGVNCEYRIIPVSNDNVEELKLLSRGGEEYAIPPHQKVQATMLLQALGTDSINGEMYCHGEHLQDIMAATKKHNELTPKLSFHVFDFPKAGGTYQERCTEMYAKKAKYIDHDTSFFPFVPVWVANSPEEIEDQYKQVMAAGYEGLIIRNPDGLYKYNTRSLDVFKYKKTLEGEFIVRDFNLDKNGHAVFECYANTRIPMTNQVPNGISTMEGRFKVKLKGTNEERLTMAAEAGNYIGKYLKVEYETRSKDGIPLKPVGQCFRRCDTNGNPIE